jgi:Flp pilus assembly secretin CpaC
MLCLAALQSPLWRAQQTAARIAVRSGGANLISTDRPIAEIAIEGNQQASAEVVGDHEVLVRGKALGETHLTIATKDGHKLSYRVVVQAESASSPLAGLTSR